MAGGLSDERLVLRPFYIGDRICPACCGAALVGLKALCEQAGATVVGAGIAIEKVFQGGGDKLRAAGLRVESLARIAEMRDDGLRFC